MMLWECLTRDSHEPLSDATCPSSPALTDLYADLYADAVADAGGRFHHPNTWLATRHAGAHSIGHGCIWCGETAAQTQGTSCRREDVGVTHHPPPPIPISMLTGLPRAAHSDLSRVLLLWEKAGPIVK